jgi:hypothetical protein
MLSIGGILYCGLGGGFLVALCRAAKQESPARLDGQASLESLDLEVEGACIVGTALPKLLWGVKSRAQTRTLLDSAGAVSRTSEP